MPKLVNCETCGTEFSTSKGRFCSRECRPKITKICEECGSEFLGLKKSDRFCKIDCRTKFHEKQDLEKNKRRFKEIELPECKICGFKGRSLNQHLINKHKTSLGEYCTQYDVKSEETYSEDTRKKLSDSVSGEKNVWFNHQGRLSPFSKDYIKYENLSEEEKELKIKELNEIANRDKLNNTTLEFYLNQGLSEEEAKLALSDRQTTFSLEKCIEKYGEELGLQRWQERQEKWHNNYKKSNYSKISQELFFQLRSNIPSYIECIFAEFKEVGKNDEYIFKTKNGSVYKLDFFIPLLKKIIEFDGEYWHNEKRLSGSINKSRIENRDLEILESDLELSIFHVSESNYKRNKEKIIAECLEFLQN